MPNTATLTQNYAENGLANLQIKTTTNNNTHIPAGKTFKTRTQRLTEKQIRNSLTATNDQLLQTLKSRGILKRKATIAIDYTTQPFYGNKNAKNIIGGKRDRGTNWRVHLRQHRSSGGETTIHNLHHHRNPIQ